MTTPVTTVYDEVLYPNRAFPQTHPMRLATIATLLGMRPASPMQCRVLEIGCGRGWNLLPMAYDLPESTFVGFDIAGRPIALGNEDASALGLENLRLMQENIMDAGPDLGTFDYIIAHGIYSWTPPAVRDRVLALCHSHLAPHGVAFISYMVYPGSYLSRMVREMLRFHMQHFEGIQHQVRQARAMLKLLLEAQTDDMLYRLLLEQASERIRMIPDEHLIHDDLGEMYHPVYFHQFIDHAQQHQLQYLAEAVFVETFAKPFPPHVEEALQSLGNNVILKQQYLDFLHGRRFRQSLLCHAEVALERDTRPERLKGLYLASPVQQSEAAEGEAPQGEDRIPQEFKGLDNTVVRTDEPLYQAALRYLGARWPRFAAFEEIVEAVCDGRSASSRADDAHALGRTMLQLYAASFLEVHLHHPDFVARPGLRPLASPVARFQILTTPYVSTLTYRGIRISDPVIRMVLPLLDGTHDRVSLVEVLQEHVESGVLQIENADQAITDQAQLAEALSTLLDQALTSLAQNGLLLA